MSVWCCFSTAMYFYSCSANSYFNKVAAIGSRFQLFSCPTALRTHLKMKRLKHGHSPTIIIKFIHIVNPCVDRRSGIDKQSLLPSS